MKELIKSVKTRTLLIIISIYWIIIFIGTSLPGDSLKYIPRYSDKLKHTLAYFILTVLMYWFFLLKNKKNDLGWKQINKLFILISVYGIIDELHQLLIPGRSCDIVDWFADVAGIVLGIVISKFWLARSIVKS